jgi:ABC-type lipoprotein export system ATPase subunit
MFKFPFTKPGEKPENGSLTVHPIVTLQKVCKSYKTAVGDYQALKGIELQIHAGEFVGIIGKSGSGKSTLLNMITGIDHPSAGKVYVNNTAVHQLSENQIARWRGKNLGVVFQFFQLLPTISVIENVMLPMDFCHTYPKRDREKRALSLLEMVELADHAYKFPTALSGGQQQRVAIARALANNPPLIIADEPTGNLDSKTAENVFDLFNHLVAQGKTIIVVTHDSGLARHTHRTALLADGEIVNEHVASALPTLPQDLLLKATHDARLQKYEADSLILEKGAYADSFYIVTSGAVDVIVPRSDRSDAVTLPLGPGEIFGEMAYFHEHRRQATVRASESGPVEVLTFGYDTLEQLLSQSEVTRELLYQIAEKHAGENAAWQGGSS